MAEGTIDVDTPCKTTPVSENAGSPIPKGYFSPVTPRVTCHSAIKIPNMDNIFSTLHRKDKWECIDVPWNFGDG